MTHDRRELHSKASPRKTPQAAAYFVHDMRQGIRRNPPDTAVFISVKRFDAQKKLSFKTR